MVRTSGAAALQGEIVVSMRYEVIGHIISSSWEAVSGGGGTCVLYCTSTTSAIFCKLQGRDSDPERHPFCFCSSLYYIHRQSQTGAWFWGFVEPTTEGRMWGIDSYLRWVHIFLLIRKLYIYLQHLGYYNKDTTIYITGGDQVEEIQGYIHLGMQMPTICMNLFGFCPRYKQDLRVVGRLFVASAGVD